MDIEQIRNILIVRIDNIGDLTCTTPAIHAVRQKFPDAKIGMLVNTYNADAIANNPDVDEIYIYEKAKHAEDKNRLSVEFSNLKLLLKIRRKRYDVAVGCGYYSPRLARYTFLTGAKKRIGYIPQGRRSIYYNIPINEPSDVLHEVAATFNLLEPLGISGEPPKLFLMPSDDEIKRVLQSLPPASRLPPPNLIAMHISSRKENNRWPMERFIELGAKLTGRYDIIPLILWSPGSITNPFHPGDDEMAREIYERMGRKPLLYRTEKLRELIAAISICKIVICCDGGAMHIAAALGKPLLTIWGSTDKRRWSPWKVEHIIFQKGKDADEVSVEEVAAGFEKLWK